MKILYHGELSENLKHLASLAKCIGVTPEYVEVASPEIVNRVLAQSQGGILLDVASLKKQYNQAQLDDLAAQFANRELTVLVLATEINDAGNSFLQAVSAGAVRGLDRKNGVAQVCFPAAAGSLVGELASHSFRRAPGEVMGLVLDSAAEVGVLMELDGLSSFVRIRVNKSNIFVWSTTEVFDVHREITEEKEFEQVADQYIPLIIFLRFAFGEQCWHNPTLGAGIVIDDPLLRDDYGFINFPTLLESARRHAYHITLAFIPWNHWRSRLMHVQMFANYQDCFSVCIHGCDHTNIEFGSQDYEDLLSRNFVASRRMIQHRERTGLAAEPLMVGPQEQYSLAAVRAFADSRQFLGLICTACMLRDLALPRICGADLLVPAQDSFFGFPIFKRHYFKGDMADFAMGLFLGKPAILATHHDFFIEGPAGTEAFAAAVSKLRPDLKWTSLAETVTRTHLRRRLAEGKWEVRFFTDSFKLDHAGVKPLEYRCVRRFPASNPVKRITVDGVELPFRREGGWLAFEIQAEHPKTYLVQVEVVPAKPVHEYSQGINYQLSVVIRRGLSEFRDNVIARNGFALRAAKLLAKLLNQTSV